MAVRHSMSTAHSSTWNLLPQLLYVTLQQLVTSGEEVVEGNSLKGFNRKLDCQSAIVDILGLMLSSLYSSMIRLIITVIKLKHFCVCSCT